MNSFGVMCTIAMPNHLNPLSKESKIALKEYSSVANSFIEEFKNEFSKLKQTLNLNEWNNFLTKVKKLQELYENTNEMALVFTKVFIHMLYSELREKLSKEQIEEIEIKQAFWSSQVEIQELVKTTNDMLDELNKKQK